MNKKATIIIGLLMCVTLSLGIYNFLSKPKIAFIHVQEVYNEFEYKKELEKKYEAIKGSRKRILDSLEIQLNVLATNIQNSTVNKEENIQKYQYILTDFQTREKMFAEDNESLYQQYTDQIWSQLNDYIKEFGVLNEYDMIHGADGTGSVMHAKKEYNKTEELKKFVNQRYLGGA